LHSAEMVVRCVIHNDNNIVHLMGYARNPDFCFSE
jgi:hypothetical protein